MGFESLSRSQRVYLRAVSQDPVFNELMGELDYSMLIVTTSVGEQSAGCLGGFATQASVDPPRYLVLLSTMNRTYRLARRAEILVVHFVPESADELVELFGGETGDTTDKFARCHWRRGPGGIPVLEDCEKLVRRPGHRTALIR